MLANAISEESLTQLNGVSVKEKNGNQVLLTVKTDMGFRTVAFYLDTGFWKVLNGKASGAGVVHLQRYFKLGERS
jgi:hypothetical protein